MSWEASTFWLVCLRLKSEKGTNYPFEEWPAPLRKDATAGLDEKEAEREDR
jgi:hypothetical protein